MVLAQRRRVEPHKKEVLGKMAAVAPEVVELDRMALVVVEEAELDKMVLMAELGNMVPVVVELDKKALVADRNKLEPVADQGRMGAERKLVVVAAVAAVAAESTVVEVGKLAQSKLAENTAPELGE